MDVVRITELQPKTYVEQGDYIAIDNQNDGTKKVQFTNLLDDTLSQENKIAPADVVGDEITTLKSNLAAETSARTQQDNVLSARMDTFTQLPSGSTSGDAELIDIRVGADGITYSTAGDAVRGQVTNLRSDLAAITDNTRISITEKNKYIDLSGSSVTMSGGEPISSGSSSTYSYCAVPCQANDTFTINGAGGSQTRLWGFISNTGAVLEKADSNATATNLIIKAPANSAFLIIHGKTNAWVDSYIGSLVKLKLTEYGNEIGSMSETLKYAYSLDWVLGNLSASNGKGSDSTTRIRTTQFLPFKKTDSIVPSMGVKYSLRLYDENYNFLYADQYSWYTSSGTFEEVLPITLNGSEKYIKFVLAYSNDATVTNVEALSNMLTINWGLTATEVYQEFEEIGKYDVSSNKLLGNITIRAAKTVNFDDGTPPINEWYLVQDIHQNFYMSKDLQSKVFLFHFEPPTVNISTWSFAIDSQNNVIAVIQASGLASGSPLSDSVRTVNPRCWLASEGYAKMHEIDFGSSFKPVGWLGNYGWCVLPNKDIVFCEYTRPTVATANVWKISGDITNASNWTVTWSHAIVATLDITGMKHCHSVQYDFYTGVVYFGTGDSDVGSWVYHSSDNGSTWTLTYGPNKKKCRMLTFVFTKEYVYWASDSYDAQNHYFFKAERVSDVIDIANATEIALGAVNKQACYGCVYLQGLNLIVMMDRNDTTVPDGWTFILSGYDMETEQIVELGRIKPLAENAGFRCAFVDWYPIGNDIVTGFDPSNGYTGNSTNLNGVCGNLGGLDGDGSTRINNLILSVYRLPNGSFSIRFSTIYI